MQLSPYQSGASRPPFLQSQQKTADLSTALRSGRDDKFVWGLDSLFPGQDGSLLPADLSSRPERTRISCHAALDKAACAPFFKERRMMFANATNFYRKSGVAQWRDLRFPLFPP